MKNSKFYNSVSPFYDSMTNSNKVIASRTEMLKRFITPDMKTAADLGCGTGNDSIALALNGLYVTGFDASEEMTNKAKLNAGAYGLKVNFVTSRLDRVNTVKGYPLAGHAGKFNIAVSLGNTFANIERESLLYSFKNIYSIISANGTFILQMLNYEKIKKENNRIVNITENNEYVYTRFYDFYDKHFNFNVLKVSKNDVEKYELYTTKIYPHKAQEIKAFLNSAGFNHIKIYSDFGLNKYSGRNSKDIIVIAKKS